jgi:hypothetical protein
MGRPLAECLGIMGMAESLGRPTCAIPSGAKPRSLGGTATPTVAIGIGPTYAPSSAKGRVAQAGQFSLLRMVQEVARNVAGMSPLPPGQSTFQLRVQLLDIHPIIRRRLLVPGAAHLPKFADMLCAVMGWQNYHLHQFRVGNDLYGMHLEDYDDEEIDEKGVSVLQAFREQRRLFFDYDFGDGWEHDVVVESVTTTRLGLKFAVCVDGQNACPKTSVGSPATSSSSGSLLTPPTKSMTTTWPGPVDPST